MSQPAIQQQSHQDFADMPVGEILRRTRLHYNRTIEDVEAALRIQAKQIQAIETGDTKTLPARVYAIGFVRSYAEYLGLDGDKIVELFKVQSDDQGVKPEIQRATPQKESNSAPVGVAVVLFVLLCAALVVVFGTAGGKQQIPQPEIIPEVPKELKVEVLEEKQKAVIEKPPEPKAQPEPPKPKGIVLKMVSNSWVEIRDKNSRKLISRVLQAGDQYFVPDRLDLTISIGNAGGVEILVDGEALDNLGVKGQVLRNIPLNADALKARFSKAVDNSNENQ